MSRPLDHGFTISGWVQKNNKAAKKNIQSDTAWIRTCFLQGKKNRGLKANSTSLDRKMLAAYGPASGTSIIPTDYFTTRPLGVGGERLLKIRPLVTNHILGTELG